MVGCPTLAPRFRCRALAVAEKELKRKNVTAVYCFGVDTGIYGDERPTVNHWELVYQGRGDEQFVVSVEPPGEVVIQRRDSRQGGAPRGPAARRKNLGEVKRLIELLLAKTAIPARLESAGNSITLSYKTRAFKVWRIGEDGEPAAEPVEEIGPDVGGLWLRVVEVDAGDWPPSVLLSSSADQQGYWYTAEYVHCLSDPRKALIARWRVQNNCVGFGFGSVPFMGGGEAQRLATRLGEILGACPEWQPEHAPPIPLAKTLALAEQVLGEESRVRYCYTVGLCGDPRGDVQFGAWQLYYPAEDGSVRRIAVRMDGKTRVGKKEELPEGWGGLRSLDGREPTDGPGDIGSAPVLAAVAKSLEQALAKRSLRASVTVEGATLTAAYKTTTYQVYPCLDEEERKTRSFRKGLLPTAGRYGRRLVEVVGPKPGGFWLRVRYRTLTDAEQVYPTLEPSPPYFLISRDFLSLVPAVSQATGAGLVEDDPILDIELRMGNGESAIPASQLSKAITSAVEGLVAKKPAAPAKPSGGAVPPELPKQL